MYRFRIFATNGRCREIVVATLDFALERIRHYRDNWPLFSFATLAHFDGVCWLELPIPEL